MNITIRQLRAALAVADHGSFTHAAEALHLTQSACSGLVRDLEASLGIRLFDRTTRQVSTTSAGEEFLAATRLTLGDLEQAVKGVRALAERRRGRVTVAAPPLLAATLMPGLLGRYRETHPAIRVVLLDIATDEIVASVRSGAADLGIGTFEAEEEGLAQTTLASDRLQIFCPACHPMAEQKSIPWRALRDLPLIGLTRASGIRGLVERTLAAAGLPPRLTFEVAQMATAVALVDAGLGLAPLPAYAHRYARLFRVTCRPLVRPQVTRDIRLLTPRDRSLSPAAESLAAMLPEAFATSGPPRT